MKLFTLLNLFLFFTIHSFGQLSGKVFRDFNGDGQQGTTAPNREIGVGGYIVNAYNANDVLIASYKTSSILSTLGTYNIPANGSVYNGIIGSNTGNVAANVPVRVEFVLMNAANCDLNTNFDFSTFRNPNTMETSVQFRQGGNGNVDFAINNPADYRTALNDNPPVLVPLLHQGDPLGGGTSGAVTDQIVKFAYNEVGTTPAPLSWVANNLIGCVWGQAYSKQADRSFFSAFVKRQHGLGPLGSGGIYLVNPNTANSVVNFYDFDANGYATRAASGALAVLPNGSGGRNLNKDLAVGFEDPTAFAQVGKTGLGDIEMSENGVHLFLSNLYDKGIYKLTLNNANNPTAVIGVNRTYLTTDGTVNGTPLVTVTQGELRPWALKYYKGFMYVGVVATGENRNPRNSDNISTQTINEQANDLFAYVFKLDINTGNWIDANAADATTITPVITIPLNYRKGYASRYAAEWTTNDPYGWGYPYPYQSGWNAWTDNFGTAIACNTINSNFSSTYFLYPQPILSSIEFDDYGSITLGFLDRGSIQQASRNFGVGTGNFEYTIFSGGDILKVGYNPLTCSYTLENNGFDGNFTALNEPNPAVFNATYQGPGGREFYTGDFFSSNPSFPEGEHQETFIGSTIKLSGDPTFKATFFDVTVINEQGVRQLNYETGVSSNSFRIFYSGPSSTSSEGTEAKGNGLGEIELIYNEIPPIEIGNRVWNEINGNGIQDANELGLSGVEMELLDGNDAIIATVSTAADGTYYFSSKSGTNTSGVAYGVNIQPLTTYTVRVKGIVTAANNILGNAGLSPTNYFTLSNIIGNGEVDWSDSDGIVVGGAGGHYQTTITTGAYGQNNHTIDFGFAVFDVLGVTYINFNAIKSNQQSLLKFDIPQPALGSKFIIERSTDAVHFLPITTIAATAQLLYTYTDITPQLNAKNYYRVKEIDILGKTTYSEIKMVNFNKDVIIDVYPNPTKLNLTIAIGDALLNKSITFKLYNMQGQEIIYKEINKAQPIELMDVSALATGQYHLVIRYKNEIISNKKIVITR